MNWVVELPERWARRSTSWLSCRWSFLMRLSAISICFCTKVDETGMKPSATFSLRLPFVAYMLEGLCIIVNRLDSGECIVVLPAFAPSWGPSPTLNLFCISRFIYTKLSLPNEFVTGPGTVSLCIVSSIFLFVFSSKSWREPTTSLLILMPLRKWLVTCDFIARNSAEGIYVLYGLSSTSTFECLCFRPDILSEMLNWDYDWEPFC